MWRKCHTLQKKYSKQFFVSTFFLNFIWYDVFALRSYLASRTAACTSQWTSWQRRTASVPSLFLYNIAIAAKKFSWTGPTKGIVTCIQLCNNHILPKSQDLISRVIFNRIRTHKLWWVAVTLHVPAVQGHGQASWVVPCWPPPAARPGPSQDFGYSRWRRRWPAQGCPSAQFDRSYTCTPLRRWACRSWSHASRWGCQGLELPLLWQRWSGSDRS